MEQIVRFILNNGSYLVVYFFTISYFLFLYFIVGHVFLTICKVLANKSYIVEIYPIKLPSDKRLYEIKHSLVSIFLFGFSGVVLVWMIRNGIVALKEDTASNILIGLIILNLFNEFHFYAIHRLMHMPILYRKIHFIHHRSKVPTIYSVFSFHWVEALLLSTVPIVIAPFVSFSIVALFLYPLTSILINFIGHCNYKFKDGNPLNKLGLGTRHAKHHYLNSKKFGFALAFLDSLFPTSKK